MEVKVVAEQYRIFLYLCLLMLNRAPAKDSLPVVCRQVDSLIYRGHNQYFINVHHKAYHSLKQ